MSNLFRAILRNVPTNHTLMVEFADGVKDHLSVGIRLEGEKFLSHSCIYEMISAHSSTRWINIINNVYLPNEQMGRCIGSLTFILQFSNC